MQPTGILETCIYVDDLSAAEVFYAEVLGLQLVCKQDGRHVFFRCGSQMLLVFQPDRSCLTESEVPPHGAHGSQHIAFSMREDQFDAWHRRLTEADIEIEKTVDWPQGGRSLYFRDPANNSLEITMPKIWAHVTG